jgi:glycosyltransferase involved in cell wall biosynthesis
MKRLSVLFATRNGAEVLPRTLDAYARQTLPRELWELIIVDNGSVDETALILKKYEGILPMTVLFEPAPGKNRAVNKGISVLEGDFVIVSDDDAIPDEAFLEAWLETALRVSDFQIFGGRVTPLFLAPPPPWLSHYAKQQFETLYAARDLDEGPTEPSNVFGPNMAVRRRVFRDGHRFDEKIGPNGENSNYPMGSETDFCIRMAQNGYECWFSRAPHVRHIVRKHQIEPNFWWRRAYRLGRGVARGNFNRGDLAPPHKRSLSHKTLGLIRRQLTCLACALRAVHFDPRRRFLATWNYHFHRGDLHEYLDDLRG